MEKQNLGGRPKLARETVRFTAYPFADQLPIEAREIREAIEFIRWAEANNKTLLEAFREEQKTK